MEINQLYNQYSKKMKSLIKLDYSVFIFLVLGFACAIYEITHRPFELLVILLGFGFIFVSAILEKISVQRKKQIQQELYGNIFQTINSSWKLQIQSNRIKRYYMKQILSPEEFAQVSYPFVFYNKNKDVFTISRIRQDEKIQLFCTLRTDKRIETKIIDQYYELPEIHSEENVNSIYTIFKEYMKIVEMLA